MNVEIHPEAQAELVATAAYYDDKVLGLGIDFLDEFHDVVSRILVHPVIGPVVEASYRRVLLMRFPFSVYYRIRGSMI